MWDAFYKKNIKIFQLHISKYSIYCIIDHLKYNYQCFQQNIFVLTAQSCERETFLQICMKISINSWIFSSRIIISHPYSLKLTFCNNCGNINNVRMRGRFCKIDMCNCHGGAYGQQVCWIQESLVFNIYSYYSHIYLRYIRVDVGDNVFLLECYFFYDEEMSWLLKRE